MIGGVPAMPIIQHAGVVGAARFLMREYYQHDASTKKRL